MSCQLPWFITGEMCRKIFNSSLWLNPKRPCTGLMPPGQESLRLVMWWCTLGFPHNICLQWHDVSHNPPDWVKLQVFCDRTSLVQRKVSTWPILKMCCPWSPDELVEPFSIIGSRQKLRCKWQTKCNHLPPPDLHWQHLIRSLQAPLHFPYLLTLFQLKPATSISMRRCQSNQCGAQTQRIQPLLCSSIYITAD